MMASELVGKKSETDVYDVLDTTCINRESDNDEGRQITLNVKDKEYSYHPKMIAGGCDIFLTSWEMELLDLFMNRETEDLIEL